MTKQIITFNANEQSLIKTGGVDKYSSNKVSYIEAHFNLGENWSGYGSVRAVWSTWYECISTVLDTEGICIVPYEVLKRTEKVMVNLVGSISEDDVLTDRITTYPIKALEVDADAKVCGSNTQPITPSEYEQFVEAVKADADRAEEAKEDARGFASSAEISAQNASISETNASTSEDNAKASELNTETYKNQAQTYAQNANNSAISAGNAKDKAEDARDTILGMRAEATTLPEGSSATASYNDGVMSFGIPKGDTGARGATGETGATPQLSIGTVETTTEPSVTITGTAENPVLNFGLVKGDKGDTGEVSLADLSTLLPTDTASGAIASFPDGQSVIPALSVVADIEPIQDLHGYDKPWSGGAGKNKLPTNEFTNVGWAKGWNAILPILNALTEGTYTISWNLKITSATKTGTWQYGIYMGNSSADRQKYVTVSTDPTVGYTATFVYTFTVTSEGAGNFNAVYLYGCGSDQQGKMGEATLSEMQLESGGSKTAFEPYENICPISGHDEVNVSVCGVNVWDEEWELGTMDTSGNNISATDRMRSKNYVPILPSTIYYFLGTFYRIVYFNADKNAISATNVTNNVKETPSNAHYLRFVLNPSHGTTYNNDISINYPSTDHEYHAYNGTTYEVSFGTAGTVYGGTVDVVSGVLTVDRVKSTLDQTYTWSVENGGMRIKTSGLASVIKHNGANNTLVGAICDKFEERTPNQTWAGSESGIGFSVAPNGDVAFCQTGEKNMGYSDWITFVTNNPIELCYPLATPQTYQLTPTEVQTLLGQNNIWADTGDAEVTYKADVTKWVEKQLS